ncbi:MAG: DASS family sodium-coupled anion symporter [Rhodospirillaceae bacterium]|nr:DASS family sodium-coupled anion symporter [Rhodospirillaceae bacterium]
MSDALIEPDVYSKRQLFGLFTGLAAFGVLVFLPPPEGMSDKGIDVAAVLALMAIWWICEPVPVYATALIPLVLFPLLGVMEIKTAAAPYANPTIFLFMGGFMIALAMQRWGLHRRIALTILSWTGTGPRQLVGGILAATVFISMWINNTSTTLMMLPIAISILPLMRREGVDESRHFETAMVLAVAYGASIGGLGTLIGTAPNALLAAFIQQTYGITISFVAWMMVGIPASVTIAFLCWVLLCRVLYPLSATPVLGVEELLAKDRATLGPISTGEKIVAGAFLAAAGLWISQPLLASLVPDLKLSDAGIAMTVAFALFVIPVDLKRNVFALNWEWAVKLPWGLLVLFGGGLSLADAAGSSGLAEWVGAGLVSWSTVPVWVMIAVFVAMIVFLSEIASNTAATAALLPVLGTAALAMGENPLLLCIAGAMAASGGFMLPVATPPNAIVFGSGHVTVAQMARAGFWLDVIWIVVVSVAAVTLLPVAFDISYGVVPDWALKPSSR